MTDWAAFVGLTVVVLLSLLALARLSQGTVRAPPRRADGSAGSVALAEFDPPTRGRGAAASLPDGGVLSRAASRTDLDSIGTGALLVNVALSQGLFGLALVAGAWYTRVPLAALGVDLSAPLSTGLPALAVGVGVGVALYLANALGAAGASALGFDADETLRDLLTPDSPGGWGLLLVGVLPIIAGFEEVLFRAALVGAFSTGFGVSPWLLAALSSVAFALGHGAQGRAGILVTGVLGFVLAAVFVLTNSLLAVVVAHYLVNALEFVVSGYFGVEWAA
ncbi:CPBP family intramembrane glutamic endopeptidase [Halomarina halobia]|uniref:CPBP family intramembrane glutamic endopeptidase n=1 Tax=Halomarina halobia TaxID=3033386 RepID=A0ABD6ACL4_9EURY|nr:CPBP family intramembrane glutamic endopeptidase [Halomarina sp. PSR21]